MEGECNGLSCCAIGVYIPPPKIKRVYFLLKCFKYNNKFPLRVSNEYDENKMKLVEVRVSKIRIMVTE